MKTQAKHKFISKENWAINLPCKRKIDQDIFSKILNKLNEEGKSLDLSKETIQNATKQRSSLKKI